LIAVWYEVRARTLDPGPGKKMGEGKEAHFPSPQARGGRRQAG
jgi:hypothetical protein